MSTMAVAAAVTAIAAAPAFAGGPHNKATGTVTWAASSGTLTGIVSEFDAHDGAAGANPDRGTVHTAIPDGNSVTIELACVNVDGDQTWAGGTATAVTGERWNVGQAFIFWVKDDGTPSANGTAYDIGQIEQASLSTACANVAAEMTGFKGYVTDGNLTVHYDAEA
jgi:hypothetical protein